MWGWVLKAALALGLDVWAKRKAVELAAKLRARAAKKADGLIAAAGAKADGFIEAAGTKVASEGTIIVREDRDVLRPGQVVLRGSRSYRITRLLVVNKLGAVYEAKAE